MTWKKGPLPLNTWNWGGVVPKGENLSGGFIRGNEITFAPRPED